MRVIPMAPEQLVALLVAITGLLTVVLVQAVRTRAEARRMDAETKHLLARIGDDSAAARDQVTNSHTSNLRDDLDDHMAAIDLIRSEQTRITDMLTGVAADVRELRRQVTTMDANSHDTHRDIYNRLRELERDD